jgi:ATP-dependent RNA helicase RhlE
MGLYGGIGPKAQTEEMKKGKDIVIATPGRFMEIYSKEAIPVKHLKHLILDEADRMMDMGFMPQLRNIFEVIPSKRQNLLFSATFPPRVERLSEEFLLWPTRVEVTPESTPVETVAQVRYKAPNFKTKLNLLMHLLKDEALHRVIIFTQTKELAENIGKFLERSEVGTVRIIHSNKGQNSRINALEDFRQGEIRILVSTDVSSRGIDIPEVSHVINFSVPRDYLDYVHRIGRTGRAFRAGEAITFCDPAEEYHIRKIEGIIQTVVPVNSLPVEVAVEETSKAEKQEQAREIDRQKKRENPDYQGAFHEKKRKPSSGNKPKPASRKRK